MRVMGLLFASLVIGAAAFGAWFYFGPTIAPLLSEAESTPPEKSRYRYAPYVVLVPSEPLPDATPAKTPLPKTPLKSSQPAQPPAPARIVQAPPASRPVATTPPVSRPKAPELEIAKQALKAIGNEEQPPAPVVHVSKAPPQRQSPEREGAPDKPPAPLAAATDKEAKPAPVAPAKPVKAVASSPKKLKYEVETDRQAKAKETEKSLLSQGTVRFRRVIPTGPGILKAGQNSVSLAGVDALEANSQCTYSTGTKWDCGRWGTFALRRFIRSRSVVCEMVEEQTPTGVAGRCTVGGADISKWIVRRGWGTPSADMKDAYASDLEAAKSEKLGQWSDEPKSGT